MKIRVMEDSDLSEISPIDTICFEREEARSLENVNAMRLSDPAGCFVIEDDGKVVGFLYSKSLGEEGYLGPLAVLPEFRKKGYAKLLMEYGIKYLKEKCSFIGLEVLPESGENLGLYHRCGFLSAFPSIRYQIPEKPLQSTGKYELIDLSSENLSTRKDILEDIDTWTKSHLEGVSYFKDLETALKLNGEVKVCIEDGNPLGFIASCHELIPSPWAAVYPCQKDSKIMGELLAHYTQLNPLSQSLLEVNGRYQRMNDLMIKNGFKIVRSINRMLLTGFEGHYMETNSNLMMRAWIG
jgi:GNAT superfamily N-acetyltransferase